MLLAMTCSTNFAISAVVGFALLHSGSRTTALLSLTFIWELPSTQYTRLFITTRNTILLDLVLTIHPQLMTASSAESYKQFVSIVLSLIQQLPRAWTLSVHAWLSPPASCYYYKTISQASNNYKQVAWAEENAGRDWEGTTRTDEVHIDTGERPGWLMITRHVDQTYLPDRVASSFHSGRQFIMLWVHCTGKEGTHHPH
jgi:hypothetical protein